MLIYMALVLGACRNEDSNEDAIVTPRVSDAALTLAQNGKEWLVINYWAIWCKPCLEEVPELNDFMQTYRGVARVLAVNFDGLRGAELSAQGAAIGFAVPLIEDDPSTHFDYPVPQVLPTTVIIDPAGVVSSILVGPQTVASLAESIDLDWAPES